jgi:hypothetical protein
MIPTRNLVNEIRTLLATEGEVPRQEVARLVWEYGNTCRRVNEKAQRCLEALRQGRRTEAMRLAKEPPDLQQDILLLDFAERPEWLDLCDRAGMPVSETFNAPALYSVAQELYAETSALDHLLRMHRRMALGRAPLADRLRVLRRIKQADRTDEFWNDDIRAYEAALVDELKHRAEQADVEGDVRALQNIVAQLGSPDWLVPPPPAIVRAVEKVMQPHLARLADAAFSGLAELIHQAYSLMDEARCRELLEQWQQVLDQTGAEPDAEKAEYVATVQQWLDGLQKTRDEEAAYQEACQALDQALMDSHDKPLLLRSEADVLRFNRGMSQQSVVRLRERIEEIDRRARRRLVITVAAIAAGLVLVGGAATAVVLWQVEVQAFAAVVQEVDSCITQGDEDSLKKAQELLAGLSDKWAQDDGVRTRRQQVETKLKEWAVASRDFALAMADAEKRLTALEARVAERPPEGAGPLDATGLERLRALGARVQETEMDVRFLTNRLQQVGAKAATQSHSGLVEQYRQRAVHCGDTVRGQYDAAFQAQVDDLQRQYAVFAADKAAGTRKVEDLEKDGRALVAAATEIPTTPEPSKGIRDNLARLQQNVINDLKDLVDATAALRTREEALRRIAGAFRSPDTVEAELKAFAQAFAADPLSPKFTKALRLAPGWRAVVAWQALVENYGKRIRENNSTVIEQRLQQLQKYLAAHPASPHKPVAERYQAYLAMAKESLVNGRLKDLASTMELLKSPAIREVFMIRDKAGRRFYFKDRRDFREQRANGVVVAYGIDFIKDGSLTKQNYLLAAADAAGEPVIAPQSDFARKATQAILNYQGDGWETFYLELAQMAVTQSDIDPILLASVLKVDLLPHAVATTPVVTARLQPMVATLETLNLADLAWMNPFDAEANSRRPEAVQAVKHLGNLPAIIKEVGQGLDRLGQDMTAYRPVGILMAGAPAACADGSGGPALDPAYTAGPVYVLWDNEGLAPPDFKRIGTVEGGKFKPEGAGTALCPEGSLLFTRMP